MSNWDTETEDPRTPGDIVAAAASAAEIALPGYPEAAARVDSYAAAVLGWPKVRRVLEQVVARCGEASSGEPSAAADGPSTSL
jgi:hypothetical protein